MTHDFPSAYQWNERSKPPTLPDWLCEWPNASRLAVVIMVLHEWESVPIHRNRPMPADTDGKLDFLALGGREYGVRHGFQRLLDVLDGHNIKCTVAASGLVGALFPESLRAAHESGHEIASHQWDQCVHPVSFKSKDIERAALVKSIEALERSVNAPVRGYLSPGPRPGPHTLDLLVELGFRWTADYVDSDCPYVLQVGGTPIVSCGYSTPGCIDSQLMDRGTSEDAFKELKRTFDILYAESEKRPLKFCYAVHSHWGGAPAMAGMLDEFLTYARRFPYIWFARCSDVADHMLENFGR
jgi:allantoinase